MPKRQSITARRSNVIKQKRQTRAVKQDNELEILPKKLKSKPVVQSIARKISKNNKIARIIKQKRQAAADRFGAEESPVTKKVSRKAKRTGKSSVKTSRKAVQPKMKKILGKKPVAKKVASISVVGSSKKAKKAASKMKRKVSEKRTLQDRKMSAKKATTMRKQRLRAKSNRKAALS